MMTNMQGGQGTEIEGIIVEIISDFTPLMIPEKGDYDYVSHVDAGDISTPEGRGETPELPGT